MPGPSIAARARAEPRSMPSMTMSGLGTRGRPMSVSPGTPTGSSSTSRAILPATSWRSASRWPASSAMAPASNGRPMPKSSTSRRSATGVADAEAAIRVRAARCKVVQLNLAHRGRARPKSGRRWSRCAASTSPIMPVMSTVSRSRNIPPVVTLEKHLKRIRRDTIGVVKNRCSINCARSRGNSGKDISYAEIPSLCDQPIFA
jgi:hypothetical protein